MSDPILIRADASVTTGTGHVMRCLALAQAWRRAGGAVVWVQAEMTPSLQDRLHAEGFAVLSVASTAGTSREAAETVVHARSSRASWIVADGYHFGSDWQKAVKDSGCRLLVLDDFGHAGHYHADLVLNQNASARDDQYAGREPGTRLLLGARFVLLRDEFLATQPAPRVIASVARKILVTLGGSDPANVTGIVIAALAAIPEIEVVVVVGGSNPHLATIKQAVAARPAFRVVVNAPNMPELMAWADVAVSAAGSTAWELAYMGLPAALIVLADNQAGIAEALARHGVSLSLGLSGTLTAGDISTVLRALLSDKARRQEMSRNGKALVDGRGVDRILPALAA